MCCKFTYKCVCKKDGKHRLQWSTNQFALNVHGAREPARERARERDEKRKWSVQRQPFYRDQMPTASNNPYSCSVFPYSCLLFIYKCAARLSNFFYSVLSLSMHAYFCPFYQWIRDLSFNGKCLRIRAVSSLLMLQQDFKSFPVVFVSNKCARIYNGWRHSLSLFLQLYHTTLIQCAFVFKIHHFHRIESMQRNCQNTIITFV